VSPFGKLATPRPNSGSAWGRTFSPNHVTASSVSSKNLNNMAFPWARQWKLQSWGRALVQVFNKLGSRSQDWQILHSWDCLKGSRNIRWDRANSWSPMAGNWAGFTLGMAGHWSQQADPHRHSLSNGSRPDSKSLLEEMELNSCCRRVPIGRTGSCSRVLSLNQETTLRWQNLWARQASVQSATAKQQTLKHWVIGN